MKVTRSSELTKQLQAEGWVAPGRFHYVQAKIAGYIFEDPTISDEDIGGRLASEPAFDVFIKA